MAVIGVIPARLNSTRFPRKILAPVQEKPMILHVYEKASEAKTLDKVIIAVDSEETIEVLKPYKTEVVMTSPDHQSGTDRAAEAVRDEDVEIVVNIQGDEIGLDPHIIDQMTAKFDDPGVDMVTAVSTVITTEDILNPDVVKVLLDSQEQAVNFTRTPSAWGPAAYYRHIGLYAFRKETLLAFSQLPQSESEKMHHLEQLRALDNGIPIKAVVTDFPFYGIDSEEDLARFEEHG